MSSAYLHDAILLYLEKLADWSSFYSLTKGDGVDVAGDVVRAVRAPRDAAGRGHC